jgi:CheY-like chemotaxis protein
VPAHVPAAAASDPPAERGGAPEASRARILVVDDEALICSTIRRILTDHDVVTLTDSREALARLREGERFDLVLCDLAMPGLSGMDLHRELARDAPDVARRIAFITGGAFTDRARDFLERSGRPQIAKPFSPASLRDAVRMLLADAQAMRA